MKKIGIVTACAAVALLSLSACDRIGHRHDNSVDASDRGQTKAERRAARMGGRGDTAEADAPKYKDGHPVWASNRRHTAEEAVQKMYTRNGSDFGARSADDYVAKVHAFIDSPPSGVKTATRANGDKLFYDARSNTFAVVTATGAPRIMMKPRDGEAYWKDQLANLDKRGGYGRAGGKNRDRGDKAGAGAADDNG